MQCGIYSLFSVKKSFSGRLQGVNASVKHNSIFNFMCKSVISCWERQVPPSSTCFTNIPPVAELIFRPLLLPTPAPSALPIPASAAVSPTLLGRDLWAHKKP